MDYPTISFIIPTFGRESLQRTLDSIESWPGDEILAINLHRDKVGGWGGAERNEGIRQASGDYIAFIDDDDWYLPGHRQVMHEAAIINKYQYPILFRMRYPSGRILWDEPRMRCGNVGSPMIFVPNIKTMFPKWDNRHCNDFNWLNSLGWEHRKFIWNPAIIVKLNKEDMRYWSYQDGPPQKS